MPPPPPITPETPPPSPPRPRHRALAGWIAAGVLALLLIGMAGQWAARREANFQADSIRRAMEVHVLGLRDAAGKYSYLPFTASLHPDVLAALAHPQDAAVKQRANRYIEEVNRQAGSDALYLIDLQGLTLAASNWQRRRASSASRMPTAPTSATRARGATACSTAWARPPASRGSSSPRRCGPTAAPCWAW